MLALQSCSVLTVRANLKYILDPDVMLSRHQHFSISQAIFSAGGGSSDDHLTG